MTGQLDKIGHVRDKSDMSTRQSGGPGRTDTDTPLKGCLVLSVRPMAHLFEGEGRKP